MNNSTTRNSIVEIIGLKVAEVIVTLIAVVIGAWAISFLYPMWTVSQIVRALIALRVAYSTITFDINE